MVKSNPLHATGLIFMRPHFNRATKLFLLSTLLYGFSFSVWDLFFNLYALSLGFNQDMLGLIRSATPLSALVLGLPLGLLSDRIGPRRSMLIGLTICFTGMFFEVHLLNPNLVYLFGWIQGAGFMLYHIAQPPYIMAVSEQEHQAIIFGLNFGFLTLASTVGNLISGQIPILLERLLGFQPGSPESYRWVITAGILLAATSLIPILLLPKLQKSKPQNPVRVPMKQMLRKLASKPIVQQLALINLITGFGAGLLIPYINVFLRQKHAISDNLLGIIFAASSFLVFIGSIASPWLVKVTHSRIIPTVTTQAISIVFLLGLGFSPLLWIAIICFLFRAVLMQMSSPLVENFAMINSPPEEQAVITSIRGMGWQSGQALGIFVSGLVQMRYGFSPLFITTSLLYILAILLTWRHFRPTEYQHAVHN